MIKILAKRKLRKYFSSAIIVFAGKAIEAIFIIQLSKKKVTPVRQEVSVVFPSFIAGYCAFLARTGKTESLCCRLPGADTDH